MSFFLPFHTKNTLIPLLTAVLLLLSTNSLFLFNFFNRVQGKYDGEGVYSSADLVWAGLWTDNDMLLPGQLRVSEF